MKVLYLFNRVRTGSHAKIIAGEDHDGHFFGMYRLQKNGISANYIEIEDYLPLGFAHWLREHILNIYFVHLLLFPKMFSYDLVFTSTAFMSQLAVTLWPFKKPKWVMFDFGLLGMLGARITLKQKILAFMIKRAAGVITISRKEEEKMRHMFPELKDRIHFIPLGVDIEFFKPDLRVATENFIISPGRDPGRDFKTLIEATRDLNIEIKITARPWNIQDIQPLPSYVLHHDFSTQQLIEQYKKARLFVVPLRLDSGVNNAMGCSTLVEAMAMGKAIIATRTETTESYIEDGVTGILVPQKDPEALRKAILDLMNNEEKRKILGQNARKFVETYCSADMFAEHLADYFKKI